MKQWLVIVLIVFMTGCAGVGSPTATISSMSTFTAVPTSTQTNTPEMPVAIPLRDLEVRSGPSDNFSLIGSVSANEALPIYGISPDGAWVLVSMNCTLCSWLAFSSSVKVYGDLSQISAVVISPSPPSPPVAHLLTAMAVHSGPGTSYPVITYLNASSEVWYPVEQANIDGTWYRIYFPDDQRGWIPASSLVELKGSIEFISVVMPTNPPAPSVPTVKILAAIGARFAPDANETILAFLESGQTFEIVGRSTDGAWYGIALPDLTFVGWLPDSASLEITGDLASIPPLPPPSSPTATPSPIATVTPTPIPTVDVDAIIATVQAGVIGTLSAQGQLLIESESTFEPGS